MKIGRIKHFRITVEMETNKVNHEEVFETGEQYINTRQVITAFLSWCMEAIPGHTPVEKG